MRSHKIFKYFCGLCQIFVYFTENTCRCSQMHILHYIRVTCGKLKNLIFDVLKRVMKGDGKFATDLGRKIRAKTYDSSKSKFLFVFVHILDIRTYSYTNNNTYIFCYIVQLLKIIINIIKMRIQCSIDDSEFQLCIIMNMR